MAKITRKVQKIFGFSAGTDEIAQFGSLAAAAPAFTTDPEVIQALAQYLGGWFSGVIGSNSPAIEDMNALCYLYAYQLSYLMQTGVPEWNSATTYYIGSQVNNGTGKIYTSIQDTNLNHALTDTTWWSLANGAPNVVSINPATQSPYVLNSATDYGKVFLVNSANGAQQFTLPAASLGFFFTVKDVGGKADQFPITIVRAAAESIEGFAGTYTCEMQYGIWQWICDGTNTWLE